MGKLALLILLSSTTALIVDALSKESSKHQTAIVVTDYQEKVLAREMAESAHNIVVGNVKEDFEGYRGSFNNLLYRFSKYEISATEETDDSVKVTAKGIVGSNDYFIAARADYFVAARADYFVGL